MEIQILKELAKEYGWLFSLALGIIYWLWKNFIKKTLDENKNLQNKVTEYGEKYEASLLEKAREKEILYERIIEMGRNKTSTGEFKDEK